MFRIVLGEAISVSRPCARIRAVGDGDVPALTSFMTAVDATVAAADNAGELVAARLAAIVGDPKRLLIVAEETGDDDVPIVGLLAALHDDVGGVDLTPVLHVTHLIVTPGRRRRGVGRALLAGAVRIAEEAGVEHVVATAVAGSRESNRYLARLGFAPLVVHRIAATATLRHTLGMPSLTMPGTGARHGESASAGVSARLRQARLARAQRTGLVSRPLGRGA